MVLLRILLQLGDQLRCDPGMQHVLMLRLLALGLVFGMPTAAEPFKMCFREDAPPFSSREKGAEFTGFSADLCARLAAEIGETEIEIVPVSLKDRFSALDAKACRLLCGATTVNNSRRQRYEFSLITFVTDTALMFPRAMMKGGAKGGALDVGFAKGTTAYEHIEAGKIFGGVKLDLNHVPKDSHEDAKAALLTGEIDAYVADRDILREMLKNNLALAESHVIAPRGLTYEPYALAMPLDEVELRRRIDGALAAFFDNGTAIELVNTHVAGRAQDDVLLMLYQLQSIPE